MNSRPPQFSSAREALAAIRKIFDDGPGADKEKSFLMRVAFAHLQLTMPTKENLIGELQEWVNIYLTAEKWRKYPALVSAALGICNTLEANLPPEDQSKKSR